MHSISYVMESQTTINDSITSYEEKSSPGFNSPSHLILVNEKDLNSVVLPPISPQSLTFKPRLPSIHEIFELPNSTLSSLPSPTKSYHTPYHPLLTNSLQKRTRRKYHQVSRHFKCIFPGCQKAYGALNHLNSHILSQKHGQRRRAHEFKSQP